MLFLKTKFISVLSLMSVLCSVVWLSACEKKSDEAAWLEYTTKIIQSDYRTLTQASVSQHQQMKAQCQVEGEGETISLDLVPFQSRWKDTMSAWQRVQWVHFGPVTDDNEDWKIQFWPDKINLVEKKTRFLFVKRKPMDEALIAKSSVVVQGLSALEFLLFDDPFNASLQQQKSQEKYERQCELMLAITANLSMTTKRLSDGWQDEKFLASWLKKAKDQEQSAFLAQRNSEIIEALLAQMERIKMDKVGGGLGYKSRNKRPNEYFFESWRSQTSLNNIQVNLVSFQQLLSGKEGYNLTNMLNDKKHVELAVTLNNALQSVIDNSSDISGSLHNAVADPKKIVQVEALFKNMGNMNTILKRELAPALGVVLGFNSNDGD